MVLTRSAAAAAAAATSPIKEILEPGVRIVVAPSATGKGVHTKWIYDRDAMDSSDEESVYNTVFSGSFSSISSGDSVRPLTAESLALLSSLTESERPSIRDVSPASTLPIHTPSPHSSFITSSILRAPRKAKPPMPSPMGIYGLNPEFWVDVPQILSSLEYDSQGRYARLRVGSSSDEEQNTKRRQVAVQQEQQANRIFLTQLERLGRAEELGVSPEEQRRLLSLVPNSAEEFGSEDSDSMEFEGEWLDMSSDHGMDYDDFKTPCPQTPRPRRLGPEGTHIIDEDTCGESYPNSIQPRLAIPRPTSWQTRYRRCSKTRTRGDGNGWMNELLL